MSSARWASAREGERGGYSAPRPAKPMGGCSAVLPISSTVTVLRQLKPDYPIYHDAMAISSHMITHRARTRARYDAEPPPFAPPPALGG